MNKKERIKKEIKVQKKIEGEKCQESILLKFLEIVKTQSQWDSFINCKHYRYGILSYETHRFYYPTEELINLIKVFSSFTI